MNIRRKSPHWRINCELFDPAALFVLVQMEDHIQLVARSDRPAIDVGEIAQALGGGGHATASAAVLRENDLRKAKTKLLKLLKESVRPTVTVRELMSFGVHTLEPKATVEQAAEMMNRYGHEGFPVAQKEKLVGIVTRRDVDRAIHHKLANTPIENLMHKPVSVTPEDSLETLRAAMIESDLGQVPVIDAKKRQILGIVTRTDVIKQTEPARPARARDGDASRKMDAPRFAEAGASRQPDRARTWVQLVRSGRLCARSAAQSTQPRP
jgi:tRNA nucleotidyltransferase (CCA-adding enzyme)